jgi:uncharacterized protein (DUF39 family)
MSLSWLNQAVVPALEVDVVTSGHLSRRDRRNFTPPFLPVPASIILRAKRVDQRHSCTVALSQREPGLLDLVVFGTAHSHSRPNYGGGHLFRDLVERKKVHVEVETDYGRTIWAEVGLDEMPHARLFGSRHAFKNYSAFVNAGRESVNTIFHSRGFAPHCREATFSGCGQINPLKNDPLLETIGVGTRILMNGAEGFVLGTGTAATMAAQSVALPICTKWSGAHGGFATSAGPECICSWACPSRYQQDYSGRDCLATRTLIFL